VSDFVREAFEQQGTHRPTQSLRHFINTQRFQPDSTVREPLRRDLGAGSSFVLLAVAHLIPEKGLDVLLRALSRLPESTVAWIAGDGPERGALERLARELGLGPRARFLGNQSEVQPYMQAADCLVCPSVWEEAAGLVNIEGLACGLPVLASRIGGIPEIVDHEVSGLLFTPGDDAELAAAARRLHDRPGLRESMSHAARRIAVERYSIESRIEEYLELYRAPQGDRTGP
jgi:glycosyltransferase involved in cell wall biosynthesis